jgi:hypothetical protein
MGCVPCSSPTQPHAGGHESTGDAGRVVLCELPGIGCVLGRDGINQRAMTTDVYFGRKVATTGAAAVLEAVDTQVRCP